ncbi:MAG: YgaP family membrane protein [Nitrospirota bacterium]
MNHNVGNIDRVVRGAVGIVLAVGALSAGAPVVRGVLGVAALIMVGTALLGFCPLYRVFGLNTCRRGTR